MDRYVGLDAHAESCTLGVLGPSGKRLKSMVVETNGQALLEAVRSIPGRIHLCLEEGTQSAWLHELLSPHVEELVVVMPPESKRAKDDLRDAWMRAEELRTGTIETRVYKAPQHLAALRNAVRAYGFAVRDVVRAKNRLKSAFLSRGIATDAGIYAAARRRKQLEKLTGPHRQLADWLGRQLDELTPLRDEAEEWLLKEAKTHPIIRTLATAPGMGPIRTAQLVAIAANPERFRTRRQFWSYSGLSIVTRSSSDWMRNKHGSGSEPRFSRPAASVASGSPCSRRSSRGRRRRCSHSSSAIPFTRTTSAGSRPGSSPIWPSSRSPAASQRSCCRCGSTRRCTTPCG